MPEGTSRHLRFKNFYQLEQEYFRIRRELTDAKGQAAVNMAVAVAYRDLVQLLWARLDLPADELKTQLSLMEGAAAVVGVDPDGGDVG